MPKVFLSPSNQFANKYAWGNTNEGKQMGLVANLTKKALERCGITVMLMHDQSMAEKVKTADTWGAQLYVPIHSNACNGEVAGTRMFCWDRSGNGYKACRDIFKYLAPITPGESESIKVDQTLFEIKTPKAPVAYIEVDFHDVESVAKWIVEHTSDIAEAICKGVCDFFGVAYKAPVVQEMCVVDLPVLRTTNESGYVKSAQALLNVKNKAGLVADGVFGAKTYAAVRSFQTAKKLTVDGVIGKDTWLALLK